MSARGIVSNGSLSFGAGQGVWLQSTVTLAAGTVSVPLGANSRVPVVQCVPLSTMAGTLSWTAPNVSTLTVSSSDAADTTPVNVIVWKQ